MKRMYLGLASIAMLVSAAPASACDPSLPTCDPDGFVEEVLELVGMLTWPILSRLP